MKNFFSGRIPSAHNILLMESGSPEVALRALDGIRKIFPSARYHLCTCQADPPAALFSSAFRVTDCPTVWKKLGLLRSFRRSGWEILVILCTGEPLLWRWKMLALLLLPAKVLVVNENADFFWLDWANRRILRQLLEIRWGVNLEEFFYTLLRALFFPLTFLILLSTAGFLYTRRAWRLLQWKISRWGTQDTQRSEPAVGGNPKGKAP